MIELSNGDILLSKAQVLAVPVNRAGIAGAGLALAVANRVDGWRSHYVEWCRAGCPVEGILYTPSNPHIYSAVTKQNPYDASNLDLVLQTINEMATDANMGNWRSAAVPALGCGLGGLDWRKVIPRMCVMLWDSNTMFTIYLPRDVKAPTIRSKR